MTNTGHIPNYLKDRIMSSLLLILFSLFALLLGTCEYVYHDDKKTKQSNPVPAAAEPVRVKFLEDEFILKVNDDLSLYIDGKKWQPKLNQSPHIHHFIGQIPIDFKPVKPKKSFNDLKIYHSYDKSMSFMLSLKNQTIKHNYQRSYHDNLVGVDEDTADNWVFVQINDISDAQPNGYNHKILMSPQEWYQYITKEIKVNYYFNQYGMKCADTMHYIFCLGVNPQTNQQISLVMRQALNQEPVEIEASYNSPKYGGRLRIEWRMAGHSIKDWQKIDTKIWAVLESLNIN